jgi:Do/DeqQ family serine protease
MIKPTNYMRRIYLFSALIALVVTLATMSVFNYFQHDDKRVQIQHISSTPASQALYTMGEDGEVVPLDFTAVAESVTSAVVHIKSTQTSMAANSPQAQDPFEEFFRDSPFRDFFQQPSPRGGQPQPRVGQGSGVIISDNGYIVTNNHVIANADDLEVTLNDNRTYKATVIGTDPTTDLALIQIKESGLPAIPFVNSDEVKVGEWVMAVGNPFNLTSTVTAGIVSAKGRNINILREQYAVESFIQTDAAINPGNSGGALVNLDGGLIGINTAIASPTGAYSGYGFAVPANIVSKVVEDLMEYGVVQRGVLGVMIRTVDGNFSKQEGLGLNAGVYVDSLMSNSAAEAAGIQKGDIIVEVDGITVGTSPELQEVIARHRPGDVLNIKVNRDGKTKEFAVTLNNTSGNTEVVARQESDVLKGLGAEFENISQSEARALQIDGGVRVSRLYAGKIRRQTNMKEGFVITKAAGREVKDLESLEAILRDKEGGVMLEGVYENIPGTYYYAFGM